MTVKQKLEWTLPKSRGKMWSFEEALAYLASARKFGIRPGLERMEQLLERLGNPQNAYPVIHIAGTNGKGSVSSMSAYIAAASGKKTGLFTSPYLSNFNERIRVIDGIKGLEALFLNYRSAEIPDKQFAKVMSLVAFEVEIMTTKGYEHPTEFEMITAAAFLYFAEMKCDLVILETGLGGRLDSTNLAGRKMATVITALGYDHMDRLGNTMTEIASEKAGIMLPGVPCFLYDPRDTDLSTEDAEAALAVVTAKAEELGCPLTLVSQQDIQIISSFVTGQSFLYKNQGPYHIQLAGDYQAQNASLAIAACASFTSLSKIEDGIALAKWPGRLECLSQSPFILIDGAHNLQGVKALNQYLKRFHSGEKLVILFGVLRDKEYDKMLDEILSTQACQIAQIICVEADFHRALPAEKLADCFAKKLTSLQPGCSYEVENLDKLATQPITLYNDKILYSKDLTKATQFAYDLAVSRQMSLISFGSLYLIGDVRPILIGYTGGL